MIVLKSTFAVSSRINWCITRRMLKYITVQKRKVNMSEDSQGDRRDASKKAKLDDKTDPASEAEGANASDKTSCFSMTEKKGDLFGCPAEDSLAHCISADVRMGKGIATLFKSKFGGVNELIDQKQRPGGLATLKRQERFVYYLVTKEKYWHKPTYGTLKSSLETMKEHCAKHQVHRVAMPKIGCGLDGLLWKKVTELIEDVFSNSEISITVYYI